MGGRGLSYYRFKRLLSIPYVYCTCISVLHHWLLGALQRIEKVVTPDLKKSLSCGPHLCPAPLPYQLHFCSLWLPWGSSQGSPGPSAPQGHSECAEANLVAQTTHSALGGHPGLSLFSFIKPARGCLGTWSNLGSEGMSCTVHLLRHPAPPF